LTSDDGTFPGWIRAVIEHRRSHELVPIESIRLGLKESLQSGTTMLGEIATQPESWHEYHGSPLRGVVYQELLGQKPDRIEDSKQLAKKHLARGEFAGNWTAGLSPHAPYSTHSRLVDFAANRTEPGVPLAMHLAESLEELELLKSQSGPFRELLNELGTWVPGDMATNLTVLHYLQMLASGRRVAVVHGNYLTDEEIAFLALHADQMGVVYCPRTHTFFGHRQHPLRRLLQAGIRVALGTDSRASNPGLDILGELQHAARLFPELSPRQVLSLATTNGAWMLGKEREYCGISIGGAADFTILRGPAISHHCGEELPLHDDTEVVATVIGGRVWYDRDGLFTPLANRRPEIKGDNW